MLDLMYHKGRGVSVLTSDHQRQAYAHLTANPRAALFLGMSLYKTCIAATYLYDMLYKEVAFTKVLIIAPDKVARLTWPDEIDNWQHLEGMRYSVVAGDARAREAALARDAEVYIVGVDNVCWLIDQYLANRSGSWVGCLPFDCVVIDELSMFKSRGSQRFKALRRAIRTVEYRIGMTGTPSPNGYIDLWAQMALLDDGERLGQTFGRYVDKYFTTRGNGMIVYEYRLNAGADKAIAAKLQDIALTMQTRDHVELPPLREVDEVLDFSEAERRTYDELEKEYVLDFFEKGEITAKTAADLTTKLLQVSSGAVYFDDGEGAGREWAYLNDRKMRALHELLTRYPDENLLLVYQFRHEIDRIKAAFPFARELRRGKHTADDFRDWNEGRIRLLLIHPAGAGHGLNLQFGGRRMVWFSLTWNLEHYQQTVARLLRKGQTGEVVVHRLIVRDTQDARVSAALSVKDGRQKLLMDEIKNLRKKYYG